MNIYVSNLSFDVRSEDLEKQFLQYGEVSSVNIMIDKFTNRSRGFAFVEMPDAEAAKNAINSLNGYNLAGRPLTVNEARPREERAPKVSWH